MPLHCTLCDGSRFLHQEVYIDVEQTSEDSPAQLTLQSFSCEVCSTTQLIQEQSIGTESNIVYTEVKAKW